MHSLRGVIKSFLPAHLDEAVRAPIVELVFAAQFGTVGERGKTGVGPVFPAFSDDRTLQAVGAVNPPLKGEAFRAAARVPGRRRFVAVKIRVALVIVVLLAAHDHAVADEGAQTAHVGVVRSANPGEAAVITVLVTIELLPIAVGVGGQRVVDRDYLQRVAAQRSRGSRAKRMPPV